MDDNDPLPDIESLVIPAASTAIRPPSSPLVAADTVAAPLRAPQAPAEGAEEKHGLGGPAASVGVCSEGPATPVPPVPGPQFAPAATTTLGPGGVTQVARKPLVKITGRTHPYKPRTPAQIEEFSALWLDVAVPLADIARRYQAGERTVQIWRREFSLPRRDDLARGQGSAQMPPSPGVAPWPEPGSLTPVKTMASAAPRPPGAASGGEVVPKRPTDPLDVPEIAALLAEIRDEARKMTAVSALRPLRRKVSKLAALASASTPHNWATLHAMAQEQARALLWAEHCEAKLPDVEADAQQTRKDAASQLMKELKSVLTPEEQAILARVVKAGADRLIARHNGQPRAPTDLPGAPPSAQHNGKVQTRSGPTSYPA